MTAVLDTDLDGLSKGDIVLDTSVRVTRESLVRYAGAAIDFNPIHFSDRAAADAGLPGVLAHGMLTAALALQAVVDWAGGDSTVVRAYETRFTRPVVVPDGTGVELFVTGKVGLVADDALRVDLTVKADGATVLGKTQVTLARS
ncbi:MaoC/PaaZ C-terminal domain-containing protein [Rhodococcus sp. HNM0569]|uniref:MaoC/PaaZ C-terminal domain-containing protein n=1 Tax=Rhodococcus sp. HNM0569 TaxID=2716340 RepID=UPI00146CB448|nr:MaoC/PaaZ C-terminal domain-containing protein [Rhodococcus sp. HNM0569]NLU83457.1 acyl dehydratase [Rhodococcus sp. HNM0569]